MSNSKLFLLVCLVFCCVSSQAQINSAHIVYERKTNLYKKFKDPEIKQFIPENMKIKIDTFNLYFKDSLSYFAPQESDVRDMTAGFTTQNTVYQNLNTNQVYIIKTLAGQEMHINEPGKERIWKIIPGKRKICGYDCQKALWQANDSLNIYAWFCNELTVSTGPESFTGLPGTILGLATEDGGIIYFAKQVLLERIDPTIFEPKKTKGKVMASKDWKELLIKEYGRDARSKAAISEMFDVW